MQCNMRSKAWQLCRMLTLWVQCTHRLRRSAILRQVHAATQISHCIGVSQQTVVCAVQYALKYVAAVWDADLVGTILGAPFKPRRPQGASSLQSSSAGVAATGALENVTILSVLLPDPKEAAKPALAAGGTVKHALAALTSLVQVRGTLLSAAVCPPLFAALCWLEPVTAAGGMASTCLLHWPLVSDQLCHPLAGRTSAQYLPSVLPLNASRM